MSWSLDRRYSAGECVVAILPLKKTLPVKTFQTAIMFLPTSELVKKNEYEINIISMRQPQTSVPPAAQSPNHRCDMHGV